MYTYPGGESFSFPFPVFDDMEDETPFSGIVEEAKSYADRGKLGSAVVIRGRTISFGIASLWSQSTFSADGSDRDIATERQANSLAKGDLLIVSPLPPELKIERGGTWSEVDDWGFGFFKPDGTLLPFSCYHDYDLSLILDALLTLERGQFVACTVRSMTCNGADDECADEENGFPGFGWRVHSCEVTVLRITL